MFSFLLFIFIILYLNVIKLLWWYNPFILPQCSAIVMNFPYIQIISFCYCCFLQEKWESIQWNSHCRGRCTRTTYCCAKFYRFWDSGWWLSLEKIWPEGCEGKFISQVGANFFKMLDWILTYLIYSSFCPNSKVEWPLLRSS